MATRIETIIQKARYTLADPAKERFSDARLLSLVDAGQKDIARQTRILKEVMTIPLIKGLADYDMPDDTWLITRAEFDNDRIPLVSHDKMDDQGCSWKIEHGPRVEAIVYDRRNVTRIKVYPIPDEQYITNDYDIVPVFGVTVAIDGVSAQPAFGVLTQLDYDTLFDPSVFGVVTDLGEVTGLLKINYIKDAPDIISATDELVLSRLFDTALEYYVTGRAFLDDLDTQYQNKGAAQLQIYDRELLAVGTPTAETDGTQSTQYSPNYITAFDQ